MKVKETPTRARDRKSKSRPFLHLCWWIEVLFLSVSLHVNAQELLDPQERGDGTIEVIYPADLSKPYRERKGTWSKNVSFSMQVVRPESYESFIGLAATDTIPESYTDSFGKKDINLISGSIGLQFNTSLGSLTADLVGGYGKVESEYDIGTRSLNLVKRGAAFGFLFNNIFEEPYVAPYANVEVFNFQYSDKLVDDSDAGTTAMAIGTTVGALIQLNHLDPSSAARDANNDWGIQNTYLDVYATRYGTSSSSDDPDFATNFNFGVGIKIEL